MEFPFSLKKHAAVAVAVAIWLPVVVLGVNAMRLYSITPGHPGSPPLDWPERAPIAHGKGRATLVMFLHPQCACSRATLGDLAILMAQSKGRVDADVYFYLPAAEEAAWARSDLWASAAGIPGVQAFVDREAAMAKTFGALTSGQTLLYGVDGRLLFKGGITALRGHSGENARRVALTALVGAGRKHVKGWEPPPPGASAVVSPVFGCS